MGISRRFVLCCGWRHVGLLYGAALWIFNRGAGLDSDKEKEQTDTKKWKLINLCAVFEKLEVAHGEIRLLFLLGCVCLSCGGDQALDMPVQKWQDVEVRGRSSSQSRPEWG
ncbi:MAG: hypothetical protein WDM70_04435 [Nitrosomonadales bacterium]